MPSVFAPGRVELLGNHTDYNEGYVLSFAVERGTTVSGEAREDRRIVLTATDLGRRYEADADRLAPAADPEASWANYVLGVVAELQARGVRAGGLEMAISSNLPMGAGLSSSAALEVGTGLLLNEIWGLGLEPMEIARIGQAAEHAYVGVKCGLLDQISSLMSKPAHVTFIDCRTFQVENVPLPAGACFVVANSGVKHALVAGEYNERRQACEAASRALGKRSLRDASAADLEAAGGRVPAAAARRARHIVGENDRVLAGIEALRAGRLEAFGELMFASHQSSIDFFENSCPELDALVRAARSAPGCLGARLSGGGFGGATINLVRSGAEDAFVEAIRRACPGAECLITAAAGGARVVKQAQPA